MLMSAGIISGLLLNVKLYSKCALCTMQAHACFYILQLLLSVSSCSLYTNAVHTFVYKKKIKNKKLDIQYNIRFLTPSTIPIVVHIFLPLSSFFAVICIHKP